MVGMTILAVVMIVQSAEYDATTSTATGGRRKRMSESKSIRRQCIDVRSLRYFIPVASQGWTLVVGDKEDDVLFRCSSILDCGS